MRLRDAGTHSSASPSPLLKGARERPKAVSHRGALTICRPSWSAQRGARRADRSRRRRGIFSQRTAMSSSAGDDRGSWTSFAQPSPPGLPGLTSPPLALPRTDLFSNRDEQLRLRRPRKPYKLRSVLPPLPPPGHTSDRSSWSALFLLNASVSRYRFQGIPQHDSDTRSTTNSYGITGLILKSKSLIDDGVVQRVDLDSR